MHDKPFLTINTWDGRSTFKYSGSSKDGTTIRYENKYKYKMNVAKDQYADLLNHFRGQEVKPGTSRTDPPRGSVGEWLRQNVTPTAISSYVCPILIEESYAERIERNIKFFH